MIPPHNSLVKYDNPVLVSTTGNKSGKGAKKAGQAPPVERQSSQTEDILNSILPPRCVYLATLKFASGTLMMPDALETRLLQILLLYQE